MGPAGAWMEAGGVDAAQRKLGPIEKDCRDFTDVAVGLVGDLQELQRQVHGLRARRPPLQWT